ncbi:dihydrolipoamide succinyltransferase, partial [Thalassolituus sp. HI0120]
MSIEIKAPTFPESVADGTVATWHKKPGEAIQRDELIVDIETDKVVLEVLAPAAGSLKNIMKEEGDVVLSDEVLAVFVEGDVAAAAPVAETAVEESTNDGNEDAIAGPAARKLADEKGISLADVKGTGKGGRVTKEDVQHHLKAAPAVAPMTAPAPAPAAAKPVPANAGAVSFDAGERVEKRVPMTRLRATIARRLVEAQQNAAMLTTYNEVNMKPIMELRNKYKDQFAKKHDVKLGFMSFFVKAATEALKRFPAVNASIDGNDMVYHGYQDIGV